MSRKMDGHPASLLRWTTLLALSCCIIQVVSGQIGFMSATEAPLTSQGSGILALPLTGAAPKPVTYSLFSKLSDRKLPPPRSASTRESEIAAIFRGVAYGAPTFSSNTTGSTTSTTPFSKTTTTTLTMGTQTIPTISLSNSVADPIRSKLTRHELEKDTEYLLTSSVSPDVYKTNDDLVSYVFHEETSFTDVSYLQHTPDSSSVLGNEHHYGTTEATDILDALVINKEIIHGQQQHFPTSDVKWALGAAWWIHVYVSAGLFALVSAASLCCLARPSPVSHLLSRLNYIFLLVLVFVAATLRCLHLFHDPYGIENRLPQICSAIVEETSWPCLTGALAVVALALYQSGTFCRVFPKCFCLPYALPFFILAQIILSVGVHLTATLLERYFFPLRMAAQAISVAWGGIVGISCLWAIWRVERSSGRYNGQLLGRLNRSATDDLVSTVQPQTAVHRGAILTLVSSVAQIMLTALHLYIMLAPAMPTKYVWVWWGRVSMARGLELIISIALLTTAFILTAGRSSHTRPESNIFSVLTSCGKDNKSTKKGRNANIFPIQNEKRQILGSFNLHSSKPPAEDLTIKRMPLDWTYTTPRCNNKTATIDSASSDFQLFWNRNRTQSVTGFRPSSMLVNDSGFVRFRTQVDPEQPMDEVFSKSSLNLHKVPTPIPYSNVQNYSTQTLPSSRYYCVPTPASLSSPERTPLRNPIRAQTVRAQRCKPDYLHHHMRNRAMSQIRDKHSWTPVTSASRYDMRTLDRYEVASYYNSSIASTGSNMYSTPHVVTPSQQFLKVHGSRGQLPTVHGSHHLYEEARNLKRISPEAISGIMEPSTCSSMSEIHVDYLTDVSSSNDCMNQGSIPYINRSKRNQSHLTLPLSSTHSNYAQSHPTYSSPTNQTPGSHLPDITPDSAVILDYSTSAETEEEGNKNEMNNKSIDLLKLSSNSLNDMLKSQAKAGLLSKIVGSNMTVSCYGYSPLDVEDTSSPSQEDSTMTKIRRITSLTDVGEGSDTPKISPSSPTLSQTPSIVTSL